MLPQDRRGVVLSHDATLDALAVKLYRATDGRRRAQLNREVAETRAGLKRALDGHSISPGDLRR